MYYSRTFRRTRAVVTLLLLSCAVASAQTQIDPVAIENYPELDLVLALQANVLPFDSRRHGSAIAQLFLPPVFELED